MLRGDKAVVCAANKMDLFGEAQMVKDLQGLFHWDEFVLLAVDN
jgi:hypothetical protein